jgi:predicted enzyme related to lactoylglutathione lyase
MTSVQKGCTMTFRDTPWPDGTPCWIDLMVPDPRMAMDFYGALLGWDFADLGDEAGNYILCSLEGRQVSGIGRTPQDQPDMPAAWTTYLATSDADKTVATARGAGGQIMVAPMDVFNEGRMAIVADPTGAVFGLWQAGRHHGIQVTDTAGAPVWFECMTRDFPAARSFYGEVAGYGFNDMSGDGFTYATLTVDDTMVGGMGELPAEVPAEVPPHWMVYLGVTDTDATLERVTELGGSVMRAASDTPYGRMATVSDNQGAVFSVISVAETD